ncbi:MAG: sodium:calcium antiporter [Chloroflexi bacterium]|nr:MAG: sodium:calcium antiporter [Chloroflexota bacterium]
MFAGTSMLLAGALFIGSAAAVWLAGIWLSDTTDALERRFGFGEAIGGLLILAITTNLPEIAITTGAAVSGDLGIAIGNILGGIAIQTMVLVVLDASLRSGPPLTYRAASLVLVLEGALVIAVLIISVMGHFLPSTLVFARIGPGELLIAAIWVAGLWLIARSRNTLPWHAAGNAPGGQDVQRGHAAEVRASRAMQVGGQRVLLRFGVASVVTLGAGLLLEQSGERLADGFGLSGVVFGATVLAASTALPEVSTGIASVRMGDYQLAVSDIFGGNAFLPVLFLWAGLLSGNAVLPQITAVDIYLTGLGILLTVVFVWGLIARPRRRIGPIGVDSAVALALYLVGMIGFATFAGAI